MSTLIVIPVSNYSTYFFLFSYFQVPSRPFHLFPVSFSHSLALYQLFFFFLSVFVLGVFFGLIFIRVMYRSMRGAHTVPVVSTFDIQVMFLTTEISYLVFGRDSQRSSNFVWKDLSRLLPTNAKRRRSPALFLPFLSIILGWKLSQVVFCNLN